MRDKFAKCLRWFTGAVGVTAVGYAADVSIAWIRYGCVPRPVRGDEADTLLNRLCLCAQWRERHQIVSPRLQKLPYGRIRGELDGVALPFGQSSGLVNSSRQPIQEGRARPRLMAFTKSIGWGVLAEVLVHEMVMGAVTQPWQGDVVFRSIEADRFTAFEEPDYVKIARTLWADGDERDSCVLRTEARVVATDQGARARFRRYWAFFSPGIRLIRWFDAETTTNGG